jgi:hypothetical protein
MTERSESSGQITSAPVYVAIGVAWFVGVVWVVIGNIIVRETPVGRLAYQIDRLPPLLARPVFVLCWCLFFLGWIVPLIFGAKRLFRESKKTGGNGSSRTY